MDMSITYANFVANVHYKLHRQGATVEMLAKIIGVPFRVLELVLDGKVQSPRAKQCVLSVKDWLKS